MANRSTAWEAFTQLSPAHLTDIRDTFAIIAIILLLRFVIVRALTGNTQKLSNVRRRWISLVKNGSTLLIILALIFVWSPQLSTFALSLTAFAVALVVATKEYLLCVIGAIYRAAARPFTMGDWIEIQNFRGEVLDETVLTTQLQELGAGVSRFEPTGRILTIPNSILLTQTVFNESYRKHYLHHQFSVIVESGIDPQSIIEGISKLLGEWPKDDEDLADRYWRKVQYSLRADLPTREPKISVETTDIGKIKFSITVFCSTGNARNIQQKVTGYILSEAAENLKALKA